MKLINQNICVYGECPTGRKESLEWIERAGRTCYQSEPKGNPAEFVNKLVNAKHTAMVEHSNIVYRTKDKFRNPHAELAQFLPYISPYLDYYIIHDRIYIGGNWRAWVEASICFFTDYYKLPEVKFLPELPGMELVTEHDEIPDKLKRITVWFKTSRAVSHELVRHRPASFAQESQRYCAYRNELEFIIPTHYMQDQNNTNFEQWCALLQIIEMHYKYFLESGEKPQEARHILPNCTATQIIVTTTLPHWHWIFGLRTAKSADPNMQYAMNLVLNHFPGKWHPNA